MRSRLRPTGYRFAPHMTLFVGALVTGAGIATALLAWHYQISPELLKYGKAMVVGGTAMHVVSFFLHVLD